MVGAGVLVTVGVAVAVGVRVTVGDGVAVKVGVIVGVFVGVNATQAPAAHEALNTTVQAGSTQAPFCGSPHNVPHWQQSFAPGVFVGVGVGVLVSVGVNVAVAVNVAVGVGVGVSVGVLVGVNVGVFVGVSVGVFVGVGVSVGVSVGVGVNVGVGVSVGVNVTQPEPPHAASGMGVHGLQLTPGFTFAQNPGQLQHNDCASACVARSPIARSSNVHRITAPPHRVLNSISKFFLASDAGLISPTCVDLFVDLK